MDCLFCCIFSGKVPASILYQDDQIIVIDDIRPQAPQHKLIIPKKHIETLNELKEEDSQLLSNMTNIAIKIAKQIEIGGR
ncbi:MAG: HIT domain-containing protein, partial [Gammaproteobacteria bacterium]|nr:HIT domain-containing protein [Gammaproteobacteria bacterium]